jgi:hypothetical protein
MAKSKTKASTRATLGGSIMGFGAPSLVAALAFAAPTAEEHEVLRPRGSEVVPIHEQEKRERVDEALGYRRLSQPQNRADGIGITQASAA